RDAASPTGATKDGSESADRDRDPGDAALPGMGVGNEDRVGSGTQGGDEPADDPPVERADDVGMVGGGFAEGAVPGEKPLALDIGIHAEAQPGHGNSYRLHRLGVPGVFGSADLGRQLPPVLGADLLCD